jgi:hypothetical protein
MQNDDDDSCVDVQKQKQGKKITMMQHNLQTTMTHANKQKTSKSIKKNQKDTTVPLLNKNKQIDKKCNVTSTYNSGVFHEIKASILEVMMKTSKEMVKLDENNEATNIKMPKTNFMAKVIFKKENQNVFFHALYLGKGSTSLLLYLF